MPRQNRVTPFGNLIADSARGTLMGNRGCLHDAREQIRRPYVGQRWITCLLEFKGRKHGIMTPGQYTELFFLDEATALAAGHRPCAECQRDRFNHFRETWARANPQHTTQPRPTATVIDAILHAERNLSAPQPRVYHLLTAPLPDGTFVTGDEETAYLVLKNHLLRWTPTGYEPPTPFGADFPVRVLTPPSIVRTLAAGFAPDLHPTAFEILENI